MRPCENCNFVNRHLRFAVDDNGRHVCVNAREEWAAATAELKRAGDGSAVRATLKTRIRHAAEYLGSNP